MEDRGPLTNILVWVFAGASALIVTLRLLSRLHLTSTAGLDDLFIVIALVLVLLDSCLASYAVSQGLGKHFDTFTPADAVNAAKWAVAADTVAIFVFTTPKLAVAALLNRILKVPGQSPTVNRLVLFGPAILMVCFSFAALGVWLGQCSPVQGVWDKSIGAQCLSPTVYLGIGITIGGVSAVVDLFFGVYPIFFISKLSMEIKKKIHLSVMFGLECVGGAVAIWKVTQFPNVSVPNADVTYASSPLIYATLVEANVLIIAACVPTIGPVVRHVRSWSERQRLKKADPSAPHFDGLQLHADSEFDPRSQAPVSRGRGRRRWQRLSILGGTSGGTNKSSIAASQGNIDHQITAETVIEVEMDPRHGRSDRGRTLARSGQGRSRIYFPGDA